MRCGLSLLLAFLLVLALPLSAGAASVGLQSEITDVSDEFGAGGYILDGRTVRHGHIDDFAYLTGTTPGTEIFLPLRPKDWEWKDDRNPLPMSARYVEQLGIELWTTPRRGEEVLETVALVERDGTVGLLLDFVDEWVSVEEQEFRIEAGIVAGGGAEYAFEIRGTMKNRSRGIFGSTSGNIQLGVGRTATGYADVSGIKFDLGAGVTMTSDIEYAQTVYGAAKETAREVDEETLAKYPQIVKTLYVDTIGLRGNVRIDTGELGVLHVYNAQLVYLGTTAGPLRSEPVYYLATTKL